MCEELRQELCMGDGTRAFADTSSTRGSSDFCRRLVYRTNLTAYGNNEKQMLDGRRLLELALY